MSNNELVFFSFWKKTHLVQSVATLVYDVYGFFKVFRFNVLFPTFLLITMQMSRKSRHLISVWQMNSPTWTLKYRKNQKKTNANKRKEKFIGQLENGFKKLSL